MAGRYSRRGQRRHNKVTVVMGRLGEATGPPSRRWITVLLLLWNAVRGRLYDSRPRTRGCRDGVRQEEHRPGGTFSASLDTAPRLRVAGRPGEVCNRPPHSFANCKFGRRGEYASRAGYHSTPCSTQLREARDSSRALEKRRPRVAISERVYRYHNVDVGVTVTMVCRSRLHSVEARRCHLVFPCRGTHPAPGIFTRELV